MFRVIGILLYAFVWFCSVTLGNEIQSNLLPSREACGKQEENRIYGGKEATIGEFPWLALLEHSEYGMFCGGALINSRYVLTAAHCIDDDVIRVRLGEHNVLTEEDCEGDTPGLEECADSPVNVDIEERIVHESYDEESPNFYGDIALLRLMTDVNYTNYIKPICLPLSTEFKNLVLTGQTVTVAGWGKSEKRAFDTDVKLKVEVPVISNHECAKQYKSDGIDIAGSQICAGGEKGKDSCQGDSGGPLMYLYKTEEEENWVCIGVVSFGLDKCGMAAVAGVYTRVTDYLPWILNNIKP